nr:transporter substrate-binding domain-containing protein [Desulfonatronospira sp.]
MVFLLKPFPTEAGQAVRLVTGDDYKPFTDQTLPQGGMITEIVDHVFQQLGYDAEIEFHSWSRGYSLSKEGDFLGTFPYVKTLERKEEFYFSDPIITVTNLFFVRKDADISFVHDSDLKGLTACKPLGYSLTDIQSFMDQDLIAVQRPNTVESCFKMLHRGRVDLVPINEYVGWEVARQIVGREDVFRVLDRPLLEDGLHFIVTKKNSQGLEIVGRFNEILRQMRDESNLDAIIDRHLYSE